MYYLGIDGGGPYSRIVGVDENMKLIGRHAGNGVKLSGDRGENEIARSHFRKLLIEFNKLTNTAAENCQGLCIGSAGRQDAGVAEQFAREAGLNCPVLCVTYKELLLATEAKGKPGVLIYSGQDSFGYARDDRDSKKHCGGWGYFLDGGSGFWMGFSAVRAAFMSFDGRQQAGELMQAVMKKFNANNLEELQDAFYAQNFNKTKISELSFAVNYLAEKDPIAREIENQAVKELYEMTWVLLEQGAFENPIVVLSGSTLLTSDFIRSKLTALIQKSFPKAVVLPQKEKPEMGAVYLITGKLSGNA